MTNFKILMGMEAAECLEKLRDSKLLNKQIYIQYQRYTRFLQLLKSHPEEKRSNIIIDASIDLKVSIQTIYEDIRVMEREIKR